MCSALLKPKEVDPTLTTAREPISHSNALHEKLGPGPIPRPSYTLLFHLTAPTIRSGNSRKLPETTERVQVSATGRDVTHVSVFYYELHRVKRIVF